MEWNHAIMLLPVILRNIMGCSHESTLFNRLSLLLQNGITDFWRPGMVNVIRITFSSAIQLELSLFAEDSFYLHFDTTQLKNFHKDNIEFGFPIYFDLVHWIYGRRTLLFMKKLAGNALICILNCCILGSRNKSY